MMSYRQNYKSMTRKNYSDQLLKIYFLLQTQN